MKPWATGNAYLNYIGDEGGGRVAAAFGPEKYDRLRQVKRVWDPDNVFCHNQNIPPAVGAAGSTAAGSIPEPA